MKKTLIILVLFLSLLGCERGPLIEDYKIEGISLGDSLLDFMSEEKIKSEIERNKALYKNFGDEFGEVYKLDGLETYDFISFFVKPKDKKYIIQGVFGAFRYKDMNKCYERQNEIVEEFSAIYKNTERKNGIVKQPDDPSGKSTTTYDYFYFDSGEVISVECYYFTNNMESQDDGLAISIINKEVDAFLSY